MTETRSGVSLALSRRRVLVTGHTGFKGSWLSSWLLGAGAKVSGLALPPESDGALFSRLRLEERLNHNICDVRDPAGVASVVRQCDPEIIFHLAAQALVRRSYREPLLTWQTNVDGTLNVLEAARSLQRPITIVVVTTDKVYKNREWEFAYREEDELGGHDPYSASKAACEIAVASWRLSFGSRDGVTVVTARAGNVLGGGDVCEDRIVPDCYRAWKSGQTVHLRHPGSTRPWQHVLEPLSGYLDLAAHAEQSDSPMSTCNFGPRPDGVRSVVDLVREFAAFDRDRRPWTSAQEPGVHEARSLALSIDRARERLAWTPTLDFEETVAWTNAGYEAGEAELPAVVGGQIAEFISRRGRGRQTTA